MTAYIRNRWTEGKSAKKFRFTYRDYAAVFGMTELAVRKAASRKQFDPNSLSSVIEFYCLRQASQSDYTKRSTQHG